MKKALALLVIALAAGAAWKWWPRAETPARAATPEQRLATVKKGSVRVAVQTTGKVVASEEVAIKCKASGEVVKLPVDVSDAVKKGSLLLQLDPANEERSVKRAEIALAISEARLAQAGLNLQVAERDLATERSRAQAALQSAEARDREAQARLARVTQLLKQNVTNPEEMDAAQSAQAEAEASLQNARIRAEELKTREISIESRRKDLKIAETQVESDRLVLSDARERLKDTTVTAPMDGVVANRDIQVGTIIASAISNVGGGATVMTIVDLSRVFVLAAVDESDIGRIATGQRARITVDAHRDISFPGEVTRVATKGVEASNMVTFEVKIEVQGPQRKLLKPAMTANIEIVAAEREDVLVAPAACVIRRDGAACAKVRTASGVEERPVKTGVSDGEIVEIVEGLAEGDRVALQKSDAASRWSREAIQAKNEENRERMRRNMMGGAARQR